jgi:hypothetical protein
MTPSELLQELHYRGISLVKDGDKLLCEGPGAALPPDLRQAILEHRTELLAAWGGVRDEKYITLARTQCTQCTPERPRQWRSSRF